MRMLPRWLMLTIKKRTVALVAVAFISAVFLTACGPAGPRDLRKGDRLIQKGEYADAIPVLREAVDLLHDRPNHVQAVAWNFLGLAYQGAGQAAAAMHAYSQALKLDRDLWPADYNLGCLSLEQSNYTDAIDYLTTYTTAFPRDYNAFVLMGRARYRAALERPGNESGRQIQFENARQDFEYAEKLHSTAEACNALGLLELQHRIPSAAAIRRSISFFRAALQDQPGYPPALLNLAIVLQRGANDPKEALAVYRQYLDTKPPPAQAADVEKLVHQLDVSTRITITPPKTIIAPATTPTNPSAPRPPPAIVQNPVPKPTPVPAPSATPAPAPAQAQPAKPAPAANQVESVPAESHAPASQPAPTPMAAHPTNVAPVVISEQPSPAPVSTQPPPVTGGNAPEALATPPPRTSIAPSNNPANNSGNELPVVEPEEKKTSFAQKLNPLNWFSHGNKRNDIEEPAPVSNAPAANLPDRNLAEQLTTEGKRAEHQANRAEAIRLYKEAIKADPSFFEPGLALGLAEIQARDYTAAQEALTKALTVQPESADARYAYAWVLSKEGYYQDAANELERLLTFRPQEVRGHLLLGNLYSDNLGQPRMARDQYLKALGLIDPQSPQAATIRAWLDQHP